MRARLFAALAAVAGVAALAAVGARADSPQITVHVDRRVELVSAAERLAGAREYNQGEHTAYLDELDRLLLPFAHHPAIELTRKLRDANIAYDAPMSFAVLFDDPQRAADVRAADPRWNSGDPDAWAKALAQLERDAKLDAFWDAHNDYIREVEQRFADAVARDHPEQFYAQLFGPSKQSFRLVPSLINGSSNYGPHTSSERIQIMGLGRVDAQGLPVVDEQTVELVVHEMGHSFVNPIVEAHRAELDAAAAPLFAATEQQMRAQAYASVTTLIDESCVRALTTLYQRQRHGAEAGEEAARAEIGRGFFWTPELTELFANFAAGRTRDLDALVPQLVAFFTKMSKRYAHGAPPHLFVGPIDGIGTRDNAFVHSPDDGVATYAGQVRSRFAPDAVLRAATADDRFETAPPGHLRLYGSPESNPLLAELVRRAGWAIADGAIALGSRRFTGPGLLLIACWPRPGDPVHGVVVYAAARDEDVVGINSLTAGGTDWVVGRKIGVEVQVLAQGNFHVSASGAWTLP